MPVRWLSPHPHGRDFFLDGIAATQKDQSFILRVRKYELRVAEPFILCRTLVPIMTAAYYHCGTKYRNSKGSLHLISPTVFFPCTIFYSPRPSRHTLNVLKMIFQLFCHTLHRSHDGLLCCSMSPDSPAAPSVCTALLPRSPRRPLSTTFCGQKQQASISPSFSLSRRFPHLGISSPYRAKLRPGFLYIRKSPDASTPRFLTDLRRNSLTFYFQNHQYQFRKCIY